MISGEFEADLSRPLERLVFGRVLSRTIAPRRSLTVTTFKRNHDKNSYYLKFSAIPLP